MCELDSFEEDCFLSCFSLHTVYGLMFLTFVCWMDNGESGDRSECGDCRMTGSVQRSDLRFYFSL